MAYDDTFRRREIMSSDQVYQTYGIKSRAEVLDPVGFGEPMSEWAKSAEKLGETIVPREVYLTTIFEQHEHRVAWVYHARPLPDGPEETHHIACDCVGTMEDPSDEISEIVECPSVLAALQYRATRVGEVLLTHQVLDHYGKKVGNIAPKQHTMRNMKAAVNFIMNHDRAHPEGWVANIVSGEHQVPLLATILQVQPYRDPERPAGLSMETIVEEMDRDGSLRLQEDGMTVSLPIAA